MAMKALFLTTMKTIIPGSKISPKVIFKENYLMGLTSDVKFMYLDFETLMTEATVFDIVIAGLLLYHPQVFHDSY
jgi:hypothetical protein